MKTSDIDTGYSEARLGEISASACRDEERHQELMAAFAKAHAMQEEALRILERLVGRPL